MVGYVNFHGPPGVNDTATPNAVELGWTVFPSQRRKGYATETARVLMDWAATEHGIRRFVSSTTPDNAPSLRVHDKLGFARTGQVVEAPFREGADTECVDPYFFAIFVRTTPGHEHVAELIKEAFRLIYRSKYNRRQAIEAMQKELPQTEEITEIIQFIEQSERGIVR